MTYHVNFNFIWKYFDKLSWGLVLSLELAVACIALGILIGLGGALLYVDGPRRLRPLVTAYVEFIRNVPLILLVYLVFYGVPSVGGFKYGPVESFVITLSVYAGAYLIEVFRSGPRRRAARPDRRRQGHRPDARSSACSTSACRPCSAWCCPP